MNHLRVRWKTVFAAALCGVALALTTPSGASPRENKALVAELYSKVFNSHDLSAADRLLKTTYIQHHPGFPSGRASFVQGFKAYFAAAPALKVTVKRMIAEDDLVVVHSRWQDKPDERGQAAVDIFRIEDGRIAEHWDVVQEIPAGLFNAETMF